MNSEFPIAIAFVGLSNAELIGGLHDLNKNDPALFKTNQKSDAKYF